MYVECPKAPHYAKNKFMHKHDPLFFLLGKKAKHIKWHNQLLLGLLIKKERVNTLWKNQNSGERMQNL